MDVLDYTMTIRPRKKTADLGVRTLRNVEAMNHGMYFRGKSGELITVPYRDIGQVLWFTEERTFHVFLFHKDAAWVRVALKKYFKANDLAEYGDLLSKRSFEDLGESEQEEPFTKEEKTAIKQYDREGMKADFLDALEAIEAEREELYDSAE